MSKEHERSEKTAAHPKREAAVKPGMDLAVTWWVGMEESAILARERREELVAVFPRSFLKAAENLADGFSAEAATEPADGFSAEAEMGPADGFSAEVATNLAGDLSTEAAREIAEAHGAAAVIACGESGIFGALWELGEANRVGMEIIAKAIPVRQETIEIAEYFGRNPYDFKSGGSLLIASADGTGLVNKLKQAGIPAALIGKVTAGNDRVLYVDGIKRFLERKR